jgi:hypothetical protein
MSPLLSAILTALTELHIRALRMRTYSYRANHTSDVTLHEVTKLFTLNVKVKMSLCFN